ncbi:MAG TPA: sigma-70 family RNA polymerase sigma factor [Tepidisphaeraceae bacterium]|jgi:RNA polymerase sigma-70 factor (ECF subfamily)|nr:sigma-70 family RNA polymerase sigma factor [Tepidisphaeraceae bacterium]
MSNEPAGDLSQPSPSTGHSPQPGAGPAAENEAEFDPAKTRPSIFGRILSDEGGRREIAWREFYDRYVPIIRGFARNMGVDANDAEDVVQEVLIGFFSVGSKFVYDSAKGRFRGYLRRATLNAIRARARRIKLPAVDIDGISVEQPGTGLKDVEEAWDAEWERHTLSRAMERVRAEYKDSRTFRAFEQYAIMGLGASEVAEKLEMTRESIYQAKTRITEAVRNAVRQIEAEEP